MLSLLFIGITANAQNEDIPAKVANLGEILHTVKNDTIPIEIWNNFIVLKVKINNHENNFIWDNGFTTSALDKSLVDSYKLKEIPDLIAIKATDGMNRQMNMEVKSSDLLSFGKFSIKNSPIMVFDAAAFSMGDTKKIKGILGASALKKFNWKFNFDENYVVVSEKPFDDAAKTIPFQLNPYNTLSVELEINGYKAPAEVDFGSNSNDIDISIEAAPLFAKNLKSTFYGISGMSVSGLGKVDSSYSVKGFDYKFYNGLQLDFPFLVKLSTNERGARIGNRLFRNYNTIFNFSTSEIKLLPRKTLINPYPSKNYGFLMIKDEDTFKIILKAVNSNSEKYKDLQINTIIETVDGKNGNQFENNLEFMNYQTDKLIRNEEISLKTIDGKIIKLMPVENIYK